MLVVDASVLAPAIVDAGTDGATVRARLRGETIAGPDLLCVEVMAVIRKRVNAGALTAKQADAAVNDLLDLPVSVFPSAPLLRRAWALRDNVTAYDACYVALAEALDCPLLTADNRLASAPGTTCTVELV
ncbi:MAG TPA: type II toxin-antitoxin system VapC family toxin [Microthrixaceae bacterium]|nr:type II toxin-antitoxin system VapC family toxin [Microthrixaceae bacterium]